jgi:hypothetical protein
MSFTEERVLAIVLDYVPLSRPRKKCSCTIFSSVRAASHSALQSVQKVCGGREFITNLLVKIT